ncbi:hypothetical protein AAFF_G00173650 [Aldrovandia affinis]|uniref:Uncharacterized protein n=1 Tax=Aldrovandia affinis TaxID=143900 RepID=A0AAD7WWZ6_9TELE|nr:hypothetical protein AAFF_G00173650 [Aldrovandia affinis]
MEGGGWKIDRVPPHHQTQHGCGGHRLAFQGPGGNRYRCLLAFLSACVTASHAIVSHARMFAQAQLPLLPLVCPSRGKVWVDRNPPQR